MSIWSRALAGAALAVSLLATPALAAVWQVNSSSPSCSDAGAGNAAQPFCTISRGAAAAVGGDTVNVAAGDYREIVIVPANGVTYTGAAGARVLGTENLSDPALWAPVSATAWAIAYDPDTNPRQVWVNDVRLTEITTSPADLVLSSFHYDGVAAILTVDVGGANPGTLNVEAGAYSFGFDATGRSGVVVQGFDVRGQNTSGIRVRTGTNVTVRGNRVTRARSFGILVEGTVTPAATLSDGVVVDSNDVFENGDSGIRLRNGVIRATVSGNDSHDNRNHGIATTGTTDSRIAGNELFRNARPGGVSSTGLILDDDSHRIQVERNRAYANQDSGFQVSGTEAVVTNVGNVFVRNISDANGDHGFDVRESDGTRLVSNTAYGNVNDGFSIEGNSRNTVLRNNIGVDNGVLTGGNDLWVDQTSTLGFSANYDVWFNSGGGTAHKIEYNGVEYDTVTAFRNATGHEQQGSGNDPRLTNPGAANFAPRTGGSAIDNANAATTGFQAADFFGRAPVDISGVSNTGTGTPNYADRGAVELPRVDASPTARLSISPQAARVGQQVTLNAGASRDDVGIVSYRFELGDGRVVVQASPTLRTSYTRRGLFFPRVTVTDTAGQTSSASTVVLIF
jgi:parallel beta-helix repeat protein